MNKKISSFAGICLLMLLSIIANAQSPNFIFILVDDQGWNGTSVQMSASEAGSISDYYMTPAVAQMALQGMTFSQGYAPAPKCSPSRNSILTGQTTAKSQFTNTTTQTNAGERLTEPSSDITINAGLTTLPEHIKTLDTNYVAAHYGKWHLSAGGPANHGFDRGDGNTSNIEGDQGGNIQTDPKKIYTITDSAIAFIRDAQAANNPFYVQLSHYAVHTPLETMQHTFDDYSDTVAHPPGSVHDDVEFGAMTENLDSSIQRLIDTLGARGLLTNTYIFYMSDNGAQSGLSPNTPLKNGKLFIDEGGVRVPLIIRGPGITANTRSTIPFIAYDIYPTIADLIDSTSSTLPTNVDGGSFRNVLQNGGTGTIGRSKYIYFHSPHYDATAGSKSPRSALVRDSMKFMVDYDAEEFYLYNLNTDIGETTNLRDTFPNLLDTLCLNLRDYLKAADADMPTLNAAHPSNTGSGDDADDDGLDDIWEFTELLTSKYDSSDNPDGDAFSNGQEHEFGTDPYTTTLSLDCSIQSVTPTSGNRGETGISLEFDMGANPRNEIPLFIKIGNTYATDIAVDFNTITAKISLPLNADTGLQDVTMEFTSSTCVLSSAFMVNLSTFSTTVYYLDGGASGTNSGTSWANAFRNINAAIGNVEAAGGGEIWVKQGTYTLNTTDRSSSVRLKSGVSLYGGFNGTETMRSARDYVNNQTIISGDIGVGGDSTDNLYHVLRGADNSVLDGFIIEDGNANGIRFERLGGGMYCFNNAPIIQNCIFRNNYAEEGAGIYFVNTDAFPILINCSFQNNNAYKGGAIVCRSGAHAYFDSCTFSNNKGIWRGGAIFIDYGADPIFTNSTVSNNTSSNGNGGGVYIDDNASQLDGTDPLFDNVTFSSNTANYRGGGMSIYSDATFPSVIDCTFNNNSANTGGGAIAIDNEAQLRLKNPTYSGNNGGTGNADLDNTNGTVTNY